MDLPQYTPSARTLRRESVVWTGQNLSLAHLSFIFAVIVNNNQGIVFLIFSYYFAFSYASNEPTSREMGPKFFIPLVIFTFSN